MSAVIHFPKKFYIQLYTIANVRRIQKGLDPLPIPEEFREQGNGERMEQVENGSPKGEGFDPIYRQ